MFDTMMTPSKDVYFISYILLLNIVLVVDSSEVSFKKMFKDKCLVSDFILNYFVKIPLRQCVKECARRPQCLSINFKRRLLLCELYSTDGETFIENTSNTEPCVFIPKTEFDPQTLPCSGGDTEHSNEQSCSSKECPRLTLSNGTIKGNLQIVGSKLKFKCDDDFVEAEDKEYTTCLSNGTWSYTPRCVIGDCSSTTRENLISMSEYTNVAKSKNVTLSSTFSNHPGSLMVDGDRNSTDERCAHTNNATGSGNYALIDLEQNFTIYAIHIVNRQDCCSDRLKDVRITIGYSPDNMKLYVHYKDTIRRQCTFIMPQPCFGRHLKITNDPEGTLNICELEVYADT